MDENIDYGILYSVDHLIIAIVFITKLPVQYLYSSSDGLISAMT